MLHLLTGMLHLGDIVGYGEAQEGLCKSSLEKQETWMAENE